jgi:general secretion pathway protein F
MKYQYRAVNSDGALVMGSLAAETPRAAARLLRRQGLNVVEVKSELEIVPARNRKAKQPGAQDTLMLMHQLCTLLESGVSLEEAVESLSESVGNPFLAREFFNIMTGLRRGMSFSETLKSSKLRLPAYFQPLAEAGELTGKMAQAVRDAVKQWEYDLQTANEMRNAMTYPIILIISGIGAVLLIFTLVVPRFVGLLGKSKNEIPFLAKAVLGTGAFFNEHFMMIGAAAAALLLFGGYCFVNPDLRSKTRDFLSRVPFLKHWMLEAAIGQWSSMLSTLLENRVPLLRALELSQRYVSITTLRSRLAQVSQSVRNGRTLADSLKDTGAVTATGFNLVRVGERSGNLPDMLRSLAILYTESGRNRMKRFLVLLEPMAIVIIGAVVGLIMAGIILAITSANNISI